jgi:SAM-dependent methyltransferase
MRLVFCRDCGHVYNDAFDASLLEYDPEYENSLHFSARFQRYAEGLADDLARRYDLGARTVVEIGCGNGDFLRDLCRRAGARGRGFDPSYPGPLETAPDVDVRVRREAFGADLEDLAEIAPDLIVCRHVLEHVDEPLPFLRAVRSAIGDRDVRVFFEVPNVLYTLRDGGIWDLIYEHCGYFSPWSLEAAFARAGFGALEVSEAFEGQFLTIHARPAPSADDRIRPADDLEAHVDAFSALYRDKIERYRAELDGAAREEHRIAVWGAGSKGATFLNVLRAEGVDAIVDVNPRKQGLFVTGTGHPIVAPEHLCATPPDLVVVMNPIYADEIRSTLRELGLSPRLLLA